MDHHRNQHILRNILSGNVNKLTMAHALKSFAISMITVFFPIFLYTKGYSWIEIFFAYMIVYLIGIFLKINILNFIVKFGIKISFMIGYFLIFIFYLFLYFSDSIILFNREFFLYIALMLSIISEIFYWMSYHVDFSLYFDKKKRRKTNRDYLFNTCIFNDIFSKI